MPSLGVIWAWMQRLQFNVAFPPDIQIPVEILWKLNGPQRGIYEWELAQLAKELIINAPVIGSTDFRTWPTFSDAVNRFKRLDNDISAHYEELFRQNILVEMYRHAHHQFGWQDTSIIRSVSRYLKILSHSDLDAIVRAEMGFDARVLYTIGLSAAGHFLSSPELDVPISLSLRSVTPEQVTSFFTRFSVDIGRMRELCIESQSYDQDFVYAFNPLRRYPLLRYLRSNELKISCPVPTYLIHRFTEGVYYEIINQPDFNNAFGAAFQAYVGEVLVAVNTGRALTVLPESEYHVGRNRKDTVDWIVGDDTGELFIECKTKRIQLAAKVALLDLSPLESEVDKLAKFVVQIYKTLHDAISGRYTTWTRSNRSIFPVIVTLEEWYVFGPKILEMVEARIKEKFNDDGLNAALLVEFPYLIGSVADFERLMSIVVSRGIAPVIQALQSPSRRGWLMHGALRDAFPEEFRLSSRNLFPDTLEQITGE